MDLWKEISGYESFELKNKAAILLLLAELKEDTATLFWQHCEHLKGVFREFHHAPSLKRGHGYFILAKVEYRKRAFEKSFKILIN